VALVGVFDSRLLPGSTRHHLYMFLFLCRPLSDQPGEPAASHAHEVLETAWFVGDELPEDLDPLHATRIPEAFRVWRGEGRAYFDR
jgi:hypothetical protein